MSQLKETPSEFQQLLSPFEPFLIVLKHTLEWQTPALSLLFFVVVHLFVWYFAFSSTSTWLSLFCNFFIILIVFQSVAPAIDFSFLASLESRRGASLCWASSKISSCVSHFQSVVNVFRRLQNQHPEIYTFTMCSLCVFTGLLGMVLNEFLFLETIVLTILLGPLFSRHYQNYQFSTLLETILLIFHQSREFITAKLQSISSSVPDSTPARVEIASNSSKSSKDVLISSERKPAPNQSESKRAESSSSEMSFWSFSRSSMIPKASKEDTSSRSSDDFCIIESGDDGEETML